MSLFITIIFSFLLEVILRKMHHLTHRHFLLQMSKNSR